MIPIYLQHTHASIPRGLAPGRKIDHVCNAPDRVLVIDWNGQCFLCHCEAWLPVSVGNIDQFQTLASVWQDPVALDTRADVAQGRFSNCAVDRCGILHNDVYFDRYTISINIDESCNLRCPSCRTGLIMKDSGSEYETKLFRARHIVNLLDQFHEPCHIIMSGNGDPLASAIMRPLIHELKPKATQTFRLFTNGLLLQKQLSQGALIPNITEYFISVDAGSKKVYETVRTPGRWEVLLNNLRYLKNIAAQTRAEVLLKFVLQANNVDDMENFVTLCAQFGFHGVINRLEDWSTWTEFSQQDVIGNVNHPDHNRSLALLRNVYNKYQHRIRFNSSLMTLAEQ